MARRASIVVPDTRQQILQAALKHFADKGYAGASVQDIVDTAKVTKPVLYYHFESKEGLFRALIDWASEERWRRTEAAAELGATLEAKLTEILAATFEFVCDHRDLTRLSLGTLFAAKGEVPNQGQCTEKGRRVFDLMENLAEGGRRTGELKRDFSARELTMGVYGMMNFHVMLHLVLPQEVPLNRTLAERIVKLFLSGGAPEGKAGKRRSRSRP
jgi:AcrR family transcriptional regulator